MDLEIEISAAEEIEQISAAEEQIAGPEDPIWRPGSDKRIQWPTNSIFRAPTHIRHNRGSDFEPKLVSIGPYHHGRENLNPMEDLKRRCMLELLNMRQVGGSKVDDVPVDWLFDHVPVDDLFMKSEPDARRFYKVAFHPTGDDFVRMLILDSCFIIRIILSFTEEVQETMGFLHVNTKEVRSDLLLLENQIPLFFIEKVYDWFISHTNQNHPQFPTFESVLKPFICLDMPWKMNNEGMYSKTLKAAHLLDLYYRCSSPSPVIKELRSHFGHSSKQEQPTSLEDNHRISINAPKPKLKANATVLHQMAGIKFKKLKDNGHNENYSENGLEVTFSNGTIRMPCLKIDSSQTTLLVNLIAFEKSKLPSMQTLTSYMKLMNELIDSKEDVELLQKCGVLYNTLSSHKMAATFFNDIGNFCLIIDSDKFLFSELYENVQKRYRSVLIPVRVRQKLYSRRSGILVNVALLLLAIQTFFIIINYDRNNPKS